MNESEVLSTVRKQLSLSKKGLGSQRDNTRACYSFYDADDSSYRDHIQFTDTAGQKKKAEVVFNQIKSSVDTVAGFMAQNRRVARYTARVEGNELQELYTEYKNTVYDYVRDNCHADQLESEQDKQMIICGIGATETDISYIIGNATTMPYGEILKTTLDPENVGWDPTAKSMNILDARWAYYFIDYDLKDALSLFQGSEQEDFQQSGQDDDSMSDGYTYNPYGGVYDKIKQLDNVEWCDKAEDRVRVYNHQWFTYETFYRAPNPLYDAQTPQEAAFIQARLELLKQKSKEYNPEYIDVEDAFTLDPTSEELVFNDKLKPLIRQELGDVEMVPFKRKCYYTAVYSGTHIFSWFKSISQQGFSIKFKTGTYNRTKKIWVGMVNAMMEPQKYHNKALTEMMFTIAANSKGGVMVEEDAVENIKEFEKNYARTNAVIKVRSGALGQGKIKEKKSPAVPTGLEQIVTLSEMAISKNGVDPSFMGSVEREDQSGILYKRRIRQVISKFAGYFDSITLYQKEDARLCSDLIRVWVSNNAGETVRITGEDGHDQFMLLSEDNLVDEYDISIQESPQTPEDKRETSLLLNQYGDKLAAVGNVAAANQFYAESLSMLPIDGSVKNRLTQALMPQEDMVPAAQVQQLQAQLEALMSQQAQLQAAKVESDIRKNDADTQSKLADIEKKQAEIVKTLEDAASVGLQNDFLRDGAVQDVSLTI